MPKPVSMEKRADIIRHMQAGKSKAETAEWLFVCVRTVTRVRAKYERHGNYAPEAQRSGRKPLVNGETMGRVMERIKEEPDITLLELIVGFDLPISQAALSKRLIKLGLTYKKRRSIQKTGGAGTSSKRGRRGARCRAG